MNKVWAVIRREFIERVRTRWFLISTILGPVFMIVVTVLPAVLAGSGGGARNIALLDEGSGGLGDRLVTQLETGNQFRVQRVSTSEVGAAAAMQELTERVQARTIDGFLVVSGATLESGKLEYRGRNVSSIRDMALLQYAARQAVMMERLTQRGVDPGRAGVAGAHLSEHPPDYEEGRDRGDR